MSIGRLFGLGLCGAALVGLGGCVQPPPEGPSVMAVPGQGKSYPQFQQEDAYCRQSAFAANGGQTPGQAAANSGIASAALGTALGAVAGTVIGAAAGNPGVGAGIGAGTGLAFGAASGAGAGQASAAMLQRRYDITYAQCMIAYGNTVPGPAVAYAAPPVYVAPAPVVVAPAPVYGYGY